jgi:hypothetical protein
MTENIDSSLTPAEVIAILRAQDRWPMDQKYPDGFFDVQVKISSALAVKTKGKFPREATLHRRSPIKR